MLSFLSNFASDEIHTDITSKHLFDLFGLPITNAIFYGWIVSVLLILALFYAVKRIKLEGTRGPSELLEVGVEMMQGLVKNTLGGSDSLARKYTPLFATMFFFILVNNWFGLLPGVGTSIEYGGNPLFKPFTTDLNGTLAMAIFGMITVQVISIKEIGGLSHLKHYFPGKLWNPLTYLIGAFEIFTEFTRLLSLALRLFLNIAVGEILISVAANLGAHAAPIAALPFTLLEIFVGVLQAFIFVVLCMAYLSMTISGHGDHDEEHASAKKDPKLEEKPA